MPPPIWLSVWGTMSMLVTALSLTGLGLACIWNNNLAQKTCASIALVSFVSFIAAFVVTQALK